MIIEPSEWLDQWRSLTRTSVRIRHLVVLHDSPSERYRAHWQALDGPPIVKLCWVCECKMSTMLMNNTGMQPHGPIQDHEDRNDASHLEDRPSAIVVSMRLLCESLRHHAAYHQYKATED